ncbi:MAG: hypothetical protein MK033_01370 [Candidatus Caenarcaniphilales bacterium]|nr:hypothetical protein [Candidatus Caenarcaniphilales bacterium]
MVTNPPPSLPPQNAALVKFTDTNIENRVPPNANQAMNQTKDKDGRNPIDLILAQKQINNNSDSMRPEDVVKRQINTSIKNYEDLERVINETPNVIDTETQKALGQLITNLTVLRDNIDIPSITENQESQSLLSNIELMSGALNIFNSQRAYITNNDNTNRPDNLEERTQVLNTLKQNLPIVINTQLTNSQKLISTAVLKPQYESIMNNFDSAIKQLQNNPEASSILKNAQTDLNLFKEILGTGGASSESVINKTLTLNQELTDLNNQLKDGTVEDFGLNNVVGFIAKLSDDLVVEGKALDIQEDLQNIQN